MSGLKKVLDWFVTIEPEEGEDAPKAPEAAADPDPEVAAKASVEHVQTLDQLLAEQEQERSAPAPAAAPRRQAPARVERVRDLGLDFNAGLVDDSSIGSLSDSELAVDPDSIYSQHMLPTSDSPGFHTFGVEKLLQSQHLAGLDRRVKRASVLVALEANHVTLEEVLQDAIARDNALDQHEEHFRAEVELLDAEVKSRVSEIEDEIARYLDAKRQEITDERARLRAQQDAFAEWQGTKRDEERRLFEIVGIFVDEANPITTS